MEAENDISMNNAMLVFDVSSKNKNISIREIAEQTGLHRNTVRKYLPSRPSNEDLVTKLMIENPDITINEIQEKLNLSYKTVKKYYDDWKAIWNGDIFVNY